MRYLWPMADKPLDDNAVHDRLHAAIEALGEEPGETVHGNTTLETARRSLRLMQLGHLTASEKAAGHLKDPSET